MKFNELKLTKLYKALFYKPEITNDKIRKEWALRPMKALPTPGMHRRYSEITWGMTAAGAIAAMLVSASLAWSVSFPYFEKPQPLHATYDGQELTIDSSMETHIPALIKLGVFELTGPVHSKLTPEQLNERYTSVMQYKYYLSIASQAGVAYLIWVRFAFVLAATALAAYIAFCNSQRFLFKTEFIIESEGAKIFEGPEAERELADFWEPAYSTFDEKYTRFANLGENIYHPEDQRRQHTLIVGNSGSGKSQVLQEFIQSSISSGLKTVILDPKSEWTKNLFDENDPTIALIDPTDARSHVWSFMEDLRNIGFMVPFVASVIPSAGKDPMWANAARMVNVALFLFLKKKFGDKTTFKDVADIVQLEDEQIAYIVNDTYPLATRLVGKLIEDGIEQNQTVSGIMINMISFMEYFVDLSRYWNKPSDKTISLYRFMTEPDYPIKTIIIRPNESESRLARGVTANVLAYMMNFIKKPELYGDPEKPVGNFVLDEFQSPGKLEDEKNDPVLQTVIQQARSFGWALYFATQTLPEAERIYGKETIAGWRGTIGTQILAGAPTSELQSWIDGFGDKKIQKYHLSQSIATNGDVSYSANWQEHIAKAMVPTVLAGKIRNKKPWIKYLIIPVGAENLYILRKTYKKVAAKFPSFVRADEGSYVLAKDSRVLRAALALASEPNTKPAPTLEKPSSVADRFKELDQEYADMDDMPYQDEEPVEKKPEYDNETTLNRKFVKEYDITPDSETDEDSLESDAVKDKVAEILLDSHAVNLVRQLYEILSSGGSKRVKTTNPYEKVAFENKKRYSQAFTGLELKKEREKQ